MHHEVADADAAVAAVRRKLGDACDEDAAEDAAPRSPIPRHELLVSNP